MNVLVIGDEHTYGYGLTNGRLSFIGHFIRQIKLTGQAVSVDVYAHLTMAQVASTLAHLPLSRYDLIIFQPDQLLIQPTERDFMNAPSLTMPSLPYSLINPPGTGRKTVFTGLKSLATLVRSVIKSAHTLPISVVLKQLRPYQHNVLIITPLPHQERLTRWLRLRVRALLLREAERQTVSVFDADTVIRPQEEYFLPNDADHLSAVSHELLGRSLFDFYLSAPTIITIQSTRRE
jgi:hypothetical protein